MGSTSTTRRLDHFFQHSKKILEPAAEEGNGATGYAQRVNCPERLTDMEKCMGRRCPDPRPAAGRTLALALAAVLGAIVPIMPPIAGAGGRWIVVTQRRPGERHGGSRDARASGNRDARANHRAGSAGRSSGRAPAATGAAGAAGGGGAGGGAGLKADTGGAGAAGALSDDGGAYQASGGAAGAASEARTGDGNQPRGGAAGAAPSDNGASTSQGADDRGGRTERAADPSGQRAQQPTSPTGAPRSGDGGGGDASSLTQVGSDLSPAEEATLIEHGWQ